MSHPFLTLPYESAFASLGEEFYDLVSAATFPEHKLRFRNDEVLPLLSLNPADVTDEHFIEAFGKFESATPFLAMRYHGYQFGEYNNRLGDGRGFLYGQVRGTDGELYDLGTKGSGTTPYSRGGDGRLTLKGGVREVLAAEMLHRLGVRTSRCLSLVETGEALWRGDEPSPTRSSVMVRVNRSHIRFGTFERLHRIERPDLVRQLLDHVIAIYYPHLQGQPDADARFYAELVQRVAELAAQWMSVGFCHAVLNTDNMSITGESFDYGPYAFIQRYEPNFTAAYFDYYGRYAYANQPGICKLNLEMLQVPLSMVIPQADLEAGVSQFDDHYIGAYRQRMLHKLGFDTLPEEQANDLVYNTLQFLLEAPMSYHDFFLMLRQQFSPEWRSPSTPILENLTSPDQAEPFPSSFKPWKEAYQNALSQLPEAEMAAVQQRLAAHNPDCVIIRPEIEAIWEPITTEDNWEPFYNLLQRIWKSVD
ncbi:YdiU family protein [Leptolyngbya sp. PL-A3]|nr:MULTISPECIES: YdiU family protein [unclassified Leptolyngbya]